MADAMAMHPSAASQTRRPNEGGVPFLFRQLATAMNAVADGGVVNIQAGSTKERLTIGEGKRFSLVAPTGGVTIGER